MLGDTAAPEPPQLSWHTGVGLAIAGTFLFALKSIFIKLAFAEGADPLSLLTLRMAFSLPFYAIVLARVRSATPGETFRRGDLLKAAGLGFLGYYLASFLDLSGLEHISAQLERLTLFTYPAIVAVLASLFLRERLTINVVLAIALCYAGVVLMYSSELNLQSGSNTDLGVVLVLGSAVSYSVYVVLAKPLIQSLGSPAFTSVAMMGSTVFVATHFLVFGSDQGLLAFPTSVYGYALVLAFVCTVIPSFMINEAIARIGATPTTVIGAVGPVFTMALAIAILGEATSWRHIAGMLVAIFGVWLVSRKK